MAVPTDEIYEKYLQKAISEINDLADEIARAAGDAAPVLGSGHPLADVMLLKYSPQESELPGGRRVLRPGRARRSSSRCSGCGSTRWPSTARTASSSPAPSRTSARDEWLTRELHIVQPKLVVVMGEHALGFLNAARVPALAPARAGRSASCSASRRPSRRWSCRTSTRRSTSRRRRRPSGTPSSRSATGGRRCPPY